MAWGKEFAIADTDTGYVRTAEQRLVDRQGVTAQAAYFASPGAEAYQNALLREIDERAGERGPCTCTVRRGDRSVLAAPDELLVRTTQLDANVRALLTELDFEAGDTALDGRVTRLRSLVSNLPVERLDEVLLVLQSRGVPASLNHLTPLGPWAKGQGGPENTTGRVQPPPAPVDDRPLVAVIDTGVNTDERTDGWLSRLELAEKDLLTEFGKDRTLGFAAGHGTFGVGALLQVDRGARVRAYKALNSDGIGTEVEVAEAIVRAAADGATVISLSLGTRTLDDQPPVAIDVALESLPAEVVVVAAAGNYGDERPVWPAAFSRVVSVAALTSTGHGAPWSTRGFWVDFSVVGEGVVAPYPVGTESAFIDPEPDTFGPNAWAVWSGTSFAAPQLAGLISRLTPQCGGSPHAALAEITRHAVRLPDYGRALQILPGT
ncbi:S8 family peptidase [Pseudonocardia oroxyli]|uniref:Subtilase family protein n=1 Tax=Pseudonocardia oroxyli TaxID=366584 RepID=A0A1G7UUX6_PSEOR|nr:S8/S53 family peptidase [Pseudonocardia oroxyli]SDG50919.1 Subtilase family protein [Pseudonocardia oroxyli]